jgi:hypothetical protein
MPSIQYQPIEKAAIRVVQALQRDGRVDWTGFKKSTIRPRIRISLREKGRFVCRRRTKKERLDGNWAHGTTITYVKIMLDWARHTELAPGVFAFNRRGPTRGWKKEKIDLQATLFPDFDDK